MGYVHADMSLEDITQAQYSQSYYEFLAQKERGELDFESDHLSQEELFGDGSHNSDSSNAEPPLKRHDPGDAAGKSSDTSSCNRARTKSNSVVRKRLNYSSSKATPTVPGSGSKKRASSTPSATLSAMKQGFSNADNRQTPTSHNPDDGKTTGEQTLNGPILEILSQVKKTNERLGDVEKRLQQLEEKAHSSSVTTSGGDAPKISVPTSVRVSQSGSHRD